MGIHGLHPVIRGACVDCRISDPAFRGTTAGIDISIWMYRAFMSSNSDNPNQILAYIVKMIDLLTQNNIKPIVVFDGRAPPTKAATIEKRRRIKETQRAKALMILTEGKAANLKDKIRHGEKLLMNTGNVHANNGLLIKEFIRRKIDYIISPYEADAQLTWLVQNSIIDFVITEDSDLVVYGCHQILFKLDMKGNGVFYSRDKLPFVFDDYENFNFNEFRKRCILSGCDYLPSIYGIGLVKAQSLVTQTKGLPSIEMAKKIASILRLQNEDFDPLVYAEGYKQAVNTFLHQVVFDIKLKMFVNLTKPLICNAEDISYVGDLMPSVNAVDFALGNINIQTFQYMTGEKFNPIASGYTESSIWHPAFTAHCISKQIKPGKQYFIQPTIEDDRIMECQDCGHVFQRLEDIKQHWLLYGGGKSFVCDLCGIQFDTMFELNSHCLFKHNCKPEVIEINNTKDALELNVIALVPGQNVHIKSIESFACDKNNCNEQFRNKYDLVRHSLTHSTDSIVLCFESNCTASFSTINELEEHMTSHEDQKLYCCDYEKCYEAFSDIDQLNIHKKVHKDCRPFTCHQSGCGQIFKTKFELLCHSLKQAHKSFKSLTNTCNNSFKTNSIAKRLNKQYHSPAKLYRCKIDSCTRMFKSNKELTRHKKRVHSEERPFPCNIEGCTTKFKSKTDLKRHENQVHSDERPFSCKIKNCTRKFKTSWSLKFHEKLVHSEDKPFPCNIDSCTSKFQTKTDLKRHEKQVHSKEKPFPCKIKGCTAKFKNKADLKRHEKQVHSDERPFPCKIKGCTKKFKGKSELLRHEKQVHSDERPYPCKIDGCTKKFKGKSELLRHEKQVHSDERPYPCKIKGCTRKFKSKSDLTIHKNQVHSEERPYVCQVRGCTRKFKSNKELTSHDKQVHSVEKRYVCQVRGCTRKFKSNRELTSHKKQVHSEERPYVCQVRSCTSKFKTKAHLIRHEKHVHSI